jgi:hypothetical protein
MRRGVPYLLFFVVPLALSCRGCGGGGPAVQPIKYVGKDAEAVLEIRDLGALAKHKAELAKALVDVVPPEQIGALEKELELSLGFTPSTEKGLEDAGLPKEGPVAVEIADGASSAMWIVPFKDQAKLEKTIDRIARNRANVDSTEKVKAGESELTLLQTSFGTEKAVVAAYAFVNGTALIGVGSKGRALVERALTAPKEAGSVADNAEYAAIEKSLAKDWAVRVISPKADTSLTSGLKTVARMTGGRVARMLESMPEIRGVKSAGWALNFTNRTAVLDGRVRLDDAALADMKAVFASKAGAPAGVSALAFEDAIIFASFSGDPRAFLDKVAPAGSEMRARVDEGFAQVKTDIGADVEAEVLPVLSGHGSIAVGLGNLSGRNLMQMMQNPASVMWTAFALGAADPDKLLEVEKKLDAGIKEKGLAIGARNVAGKEVRVLQKPIEGQEPAMIVETVTVGGARIFSNDAKRTDEVVARASGSPKDPLAGKAGGVLELRLGKLAETLRSFDFGALPVLYRALVAKAVSLVGVFDRIVVHFAPAEDGITFSAQVALKAETAAKQ